MTKKDWWAITKPKSRKLLFVDGKATLVKLNSKIRCNDPIARMYFLLYREDLLHKVAWHDEMEYLYGDGIVK